MAARHDEDGIAPASNDAYTGMLSISLLALIGASVLLYLDYSQYPDGNPPQVQKLTPDKKLEINPILKAKAENKDFHLKPDTVELFLGKEVTVNVRNGKADSADVDPADPNVKADIVDATIKVSAGPEAKEGAYTVTVKGEKDKQAILKVTVKKEKE